MRWLQEALAMMARSLLTRGGDAVVDVVGGSLFEGRRDASSKTAELDLLLLRPDR